jgi:hypothetical protein
MKYLGKILLFLSSYLPVWLIYAISQGLTLNAISIFGILLTIISISTIFIFKATYEAPTRRNAVYIFIENISNGSSEAISYLLSLIIPLATSTIPFQLFGGIFSQNFQNEIVTLILGLAIFYIYIRTNLVVMNPIMMLSGYSLYIITYKPAEQSKITLDAILITRQKNDLKDISTPTMVTCVEQDVYLYRC